MGLVGIAVGALTFVWPGLTAVGLYAAVAGWSIVRGVLEIALAIELRKVIEGEFWLIFGGIASILFGVLMIALPLAGLLVLAWLIAVYALVFGVVMFALAARLHRAEDADVHATAVGDGTAGRDLTADALALRGLRAVIVRNPVPECRARRSHVPLAARPRQRRRSTVAAARQPRRIPRSADRPGAGLGATRRGSSADAICRPAAPGSRCTAMDASPR